MRGPGKLKQHNCTGKGGRGGGRRLRFFSLLFLIWWPEAKHWHRGPDVKSSGCVLASPGTKGFIWDGWGSPGQVLLVANCACVYNSVPGEPDEAYKAQHLTRLQDQGKHPGRGSSAGGGWKWRGQCLLGLECSRLPLPSWLVVSSLSGSSHRERAKRWSKTKLSILKRKVVNSELPPEFPRLVYF